jgi:hypothetical protein
MKRRTMLVAGAALAINFALPLAARADQAIFGGEMILKLAPGQNVEHIDPLVLSRYGIPTVVFDAGASTFADNETLVATIALSTMDVDDLGTVELLGPSTLTGTTPVGWSMEPPDPSTSDFTFDPPISFRYTAPSAAELHCAANPGETFRTSIAVAATVVGSAGTTASFSAQDFPGVVRVEVTCAPAAPSPQVTPPPSTDMTPPPTDTTGTSATEPTQASFLAWFAIVGAALVVVAVAASLTRRIR